MKSDLIDACFDEHAALIDDVRKTLASEIKLFAGIAIDAIESDRSIIFCGNGGSASDANHLCAELVGRFLAHRKSLSALSLSSNSASITAIANDYGFDRIFSRQIEGVGREGDVLVVLSTSGNSLNIINALSCANSSGIRTLGFLGMDGGSAAGLCDHKIIVPSLSTARIQEAHILIGHILCELIEKHIFC